jgi:DNA-binding response OmpR family regulator
MRVLVVDDEFDFRESLIEILQIKGHDAFGVGSIADYFHLPESITFDLAVIDRLLTDGDGIEIARHIRKTKQSRVVLISGVVSLELGDFASEIVPDLRISKPFIVKPLLEFIAQLSC